MGAYFLFLHHNAIINTITFFFLPKMSINGNLPHAEFCIGLYRPDLYSDMFLMTTAQRAPIKDLSLLIRPLQRRAAWEPHVNKGKFENVNSKSPNRPSTLLLPSSSRLSSAPPALRVSGGIGGINCLDDKQRPKDERVLMSLFPGNKSDWDFK